MDKAPGVDPKRIVAIFYVVAAVVLGVFLEKALGILFSYARWNDVAVLGEDWTLTTILGYAVAVVVAFVAWRSRATRGYAMQVAQELERVTWPSWRETRASTVAVIIFSFVAAAILGVFDLVWARLSSLVY